MTATLNDLDQAFEELWLHTEQLPTLLEHWQEMVSAYLREVEPTEQTLAEFEAKMDHWQRVLEENRDLLQAYQVTLKDKIATGEPSPLKKGKADRYR